MRDIKFSTVYPKYHPRAGQSTHFVEKIWSSFIDTDKMISLFAISDCEKLQEAQRNFHEKDWTPKRTKIRAGHRWKKGDMFIPKIWTGLPYRSKPIAICEPLEVLETEDFSIDMDGNYWLGDSMQSLSQLKHLSLDDGFDELDDFELWFNWKFETTFDGQRIRFA